MKSSIISLISADELKTIIQSCKTLSEVLLKLGLNAQSGQYAALNKRLSAENISTSHFVRYIPTRKNKILDELVFVKGYKISQGALRNRFKKCTVYKCNKCGLDNIWNGKPIKLQMDHINGDRLDNSKDNLRWLCPNCHSQTATYAGKGQMRAKVNKIAAIELEKLRLQSKENDHKTRKNIILNSGINFSKFGWLVSVAKLINKTPQSTRHWIIQNMPEFYKEKCFKK